MNKLLFYSLCAAPTAMIFADAFGCEALKVIALIALGCSIIGALFMLKD